MTLRGMEVEGTHCLMMGCRMMFGKVIGATQASFLPEDVELLLPYAIAYPIKTHVNGFGPFLFDSIVNNAMLLWLCESAPSSASAALDKTSRIIWDWTVAGWRRICGSWCNVRVLGAAAEEMVTTGSGSSFVFG